MSSIELPDWLEREAWHDFVKFRTMVKKPMTERAKQRAINKLEKLREQGEDPAKVLDQSVDAGWTDLYPYREKDVNTSPENYL
jgi:hypothetical protein|tara:strand:+ start:318 stop:566 length:249 start_codon:yes stop_codon:yes gene_type:complete